MDSKSVLHFPSAREFDIKLLVSQASDQTAMLPGRPLRTSERIPTGKVRAIRDDCYAPAVLAMGAPFPKIR